jgi:hypothetical protein
MKAIVFVLAAAAAWQAPGYFFPHRLKLECPTESCVLGRWLACADTTVRERPGSSQWAIGQIPRGARFPVVGAELLTLEPGVVRVTRDVEQGGRAFKAGETLLLLGHVGEGFFAVSYQGRSGTVEIFWPWKRAGGFSVAGELVRDAVTERWMQTVVAGQPGWVQDDAASIVSPAGQVELIRCPAGQ